MKKGSSSKGGSSSQKLSDKKMRKMEARVLEEKLVTLRAAVFEPDGKDRNVCAPLAPFMKRVAASFNKPSTRRRRPTTQVRPQRPRLHDRLLQQITGRREALGL